MVVSTSLQDNVTSRTLSTMFNKGKIYFQTDKNFITVKQLIENPNIALCTNNIQITGTAKIIGPTIGQGILEEIYKEKHLGSYNNYSSLATTVMIEVEIKNTTLWVYRDKIPFLCFYDMVKKEYKEKRYI